MVFLFLSIGFIVLLFVFVFRSAKRSKLKSHKKPIKPSSIPQSLPSSKGKWVARNAQFICKKCGCVMGISRQGARMLKPECCGVRMVRSRCHHSMVEPSFGSERGNPNVAICQDCHCLLDWVEQSKGKGKTV